MHEKDFQRATPFIQRNRKGCRVVSTKVFTRASILSKASGMERCRGCVGVFACLVWMGEMETQRGTEPQREFQRVSRRELQYCFSCSSTSSVFRIAQWKGKDRSLDTLDEDHRTGPQDMFHKRRRSEIHVCPAE